jgi:hypothetical protein
VKTVEGTVFGALSYSKGRGVLLGLSYFFWRHLQATPASA